MPIWFQINALDAERVPGGHACDNAASVSSAQSREIELP
jgi:hypothetical protein